MSKFTFFTWLVAMAVAVLYLALGIPSMLVTPPDKEPKSLPESKDEIQDFDNYTPEAYKWK